jgi:tRNA(His) guanylyltransferase
MTTLSDRQKKYEEAYNYTILPKLPVVVRAEVRNFPRLTRNLEKPYCPELWRIMRETMFSTVMEIDGAVFSYCHGAEMSFIIYGADEKDSPDFYSNNIQNMGTIISSLCSINFMKHFLSSDDPPDILGEAVFKVKVTGIPSTTETMDYLLWRQQIAVSNAVSIAIETEMSKIYDWKDVLLSLNRNSIAEKKDLLYTECGINYENYPSYFKLGSGCYKAPKIIHTESGEVVKKKWTLDTDIPDFLDDKDFIMNIIHTGQDVMRPDRDIIS